MLVSLLLDVHEVLAKLSSELQIRNLVFSEYQPLIDATYAQLEHLGTNDGSALRIVLRSRQKKVRIMLIWLVKS